MFAIRAATFTFLVLCLVIGCNSSQTPAKVIGKVTYNGKPLPAGNVTFHTAIGSYNAPIHQDGTGVFDITDLPSGTAEVSIDNEFLNPDYKAPDYKAEKGGKAGGGMAGMQKKAMGGGAGAGTKPDMKKGAHLASERKAAEGFGPPSAEALAARYVKLPVRYHKKETSKLTYELKAGKNEINIDLTN